MTFTITGKHIALVAIPLCWWLAGRALWSVFNGNGGLTGLIAWGVAGLTSVGAFVYLLLSL